MLFSLLDDQVPRRGPRFGVVHNIAHAWLIYEVPQWRVNWLSVSDLNSLANCKVNWYGCIHPAVLEYIPMARYCLRDVEGLQLTVDFINSMLATFLAVTVP